MSKPNSAATTLPHFAVIIECALRPLLWPGVYLASGLEDAVKIETLSVLNMNDSLKLGSTCVYLSNSKVNDNLCVSIQFSMAYSLYYTGLLFWCCHFYLYLTFSQSIEALFT